MLQTRTRIKPAESGNLLENLNCLGGGSDSFVGDIPIILNTQVLQPFKDRDRGWLLGQHLDPCSGKKRTPWQKIAKFKQSAQNA
jgi:hypothetical protein